MEYSILKKWNESDNIKVQNRASQTNPPNPQATKKETANRKSRNRRSKKEKATKRKIFRRLVSKGDSSESAEREV